MADSSGWTNLKGVVQEVLFETGRDQGLYKKYMHLAINGLRDLNMFHFNNVKTVKVTANDLGVIEYPSDWVGFVKLSLDLNGELYPLTERCNLIPTTTTEEGDEVLDSDIGEGVSPDTGQTLYYGYQTVGGKNDYYYALDDRNTRIIVRGVPTRNLFLQYTTSGVDTDDGTETNVPQKVKEVLKLYILYKDALTNDKANKNLYGMYKSEYREEVSKLHMFELPSTDELRDMVYECMGAVKR
jgi:hypothetical protein